MARLSVRWISALVMALLLIALLGLVVVVRPGGFSIDPWFEQPGLLVGVIVSTCLLAWWSGEGVTRSGWLRAAAVGTGVGVVWWPTLVVVAVIVAVVDATLRGTANPVSGLGQAAIWGAYGIAVIGVLCAIVAVPIGIIWGLLTRALARAIRAPRSTARRAGVLAGGAFLLLGIVGGVAQARSTLPPEASCLDLGGYPTAAAFSPDGTLLAVTTQTDPNGPGEVIVLAWPTRHDVGRWTAWVDQSVAVADDGRVYWPAWVLGLSDSSEATGDGIYTAMGDERPHLIASGYEPTLNDLTWTVDGLRGITPNSHQFAILPFGEDRIQVLPDQPAEEVGAFWASPDGGTTAWSEIWSGSTVTIDSPSGRRTVPVGGDQRSIAMSPDARTLVAAAWGGGTRLVDLESGASRLILNGAQQFVRLSSRGDLAWASDDQIGHGRLCTAALSDLAD